MDAYQILQAIDKSGNITEARFNELKIAFAEGYLNEKNYEERLSLHRNPSELKNELLTDLNTYLQKIQQREEMRDIDLGKNSSGYVSTKVGEIWRADKRLNSDYDAIEIYCRLRSKDLATISVHMAEYKALSELFSKIQQSTYQRSNPINEPIIQPLPVGKTVHPLNFENLGWEQFEWLVFAYVNGLKAWEKIEWLGQSGGDGGRDIWGESNGKNYCYQCANYRSLELKKVKDDIDKLIKANILPDRFTVICGGRVSANMRSLINSYAAQYGISETAVWSAPELEEKLRLEAPDLVKRFFEGNPFPEISFPQKDNGPANILDKIAIQNTEVLELLKKIVPKADDNIVVVTIRPGYRTAELMEIANKRFRPDAGHKPFKNIVSTVLLIERFIIDIELVRQLAVSKTITQVFINHFNAEQITSDFFEDEVRNLTFDIFNFKEIENLENVKYTFKKDLSGLSNLRNTSDFSFLYSNKILEFIFFELLLNAKKNRWLSIHQDFINEIQVNVVFNKDILMVRFKNTGPQVEQQTLMNLNSSMDLSRQEDTSGIYLIKKMFDCFDIGNIRFFSEEIEHHLSWFIVELNLHAWNEQDFTD